MVEMSNEVDKVLSDNSEDKGSKPVKMPRIVIEKVKFDC